MSDYPLLTSNTITLRQFDYFVNTVQLGSLSAAARRFGITPSAMSQQIDSLESSLGRKLFDPRSRRSRLTKFGREFFTQASDVVDSVRQAMAMGQTFGDGVMTVGTTPTIAQKLLPPLIYRMRLERNIDNIEVRSFTDIRELHSTLDEGALDLAVGPLERSTAKVFHCFGEEELVVVCHHSHRNSFDGSWKQLIEAPWIRCGANSDLTDILSREAGRAGVHIRFAVRAPDVSTALSLVEHGVGVALVPRMALHGSSRLVSIVRLPRPIRRELTVHARDKSPYVEKFLDAITDTELVRKFGAAGLFDIRRPKLESASRPQVPAQIGARDATFIPEAKAQ
ncbi:LysR family transcriptional regulator [Nocardia brasiliensis]|uniref:LysR family transcriptional regulator n=1 Tax=Nocardia brasiliensis TaxID=37326 RepID=A0A6G9XX66_NOCBR|nr:LysR family transcriptional regulator [Nocardia brasiliensis]QIS05486.1 LysR family transcriptional regulator [Nocardia brasiliensis]